MQMTCRTHESYIISSFSPKKNPTHSHQIRIQLSFFFSFIRDKLLLNILTSNRSKECTRHVYETIKGTYTKYNNKITEVEEGFPETGTVSSIHERHVGQRSF